MFYERDFVDRVVSSNNIVDVISSYVNLNKAGSSHKGCCPFHNEKTPSFVVSESKGIFNCFGCGAKGNVIGFIMKIENISYPEAIKLLAERANIPLPTRDMSEDEMKKLREKKILYGINKEAGNYYYMALRKTKENPGINYLSDKRGLSLDTQKKFALGYSSGGFGLLDYLKSKNYKEADIEKAGLIAKSQKGHYYDRFFGRVIFPIQDVNNNVIGFGGRQLEGEGAKYLNSPETVVFSKRTNLFALNIARKTARAELIMAEGYMDVISLHQAGFDNAVASLGTALTSEQAMLIKKYKRDVILIYDSDNAGIEAALRGIPILKKAGINVRVLNVVGAKDPDEYIKANGSEAFGKLLETAMPYIDYELKVLKGRYNLDDTNEKLKFIDAIIDRIKLINNIIDTDIYLDKLSLITKVSKETLLRKYQGEKVDVMPVKPKVVVNAENNILADKYKDLISLIINSKEIYELAKKYICIDDIKNKALKNILTIIYDEYEKKGIIDNALILNSFETQDEQSVYLDIVKRTKNFTRADSVKAIEKMIKEYLIQNISDKIEECNNILKSESSTDSEIDKASNELTGLVLERSNINKMIIK